VISVENRRFLPPRIFSAPMKGFPRGWVTMLGFKELGWWCYRERSFTRLYLESHGYSTRTWQTDRRTDTGRRPRLCI